MLKASGIKKWHKQFRWLQDQVRHKGVIFMHETHSCGETKKKWVDEFEKQKQIAFQPWEIKC